MQQIYNYTFELNLCDGKKVRRDCKTVKHTSYREAHKALEKFVEGLGWYVLDSKLVDMFEDGTDSITG